MASLLNPYRPPAFCPGCSHEVSLYALDRALAELGLHAHEVVMVSDIGCSGLFDTFFTTHAFHGLHGRALTYAAGIKLARPRLKVVVTMGDGGVGIGGAHFLAACRRNLDLTLLILNNFNFGMTGGQFSCTTPADASVVSGFLNALEKPMDICSVAASAGAPFVARGAVYQKDLTSLLVEAIRFDGFSVVDLWGVCTGHYRRRNPLTPQEIASTMRELPPFAGLAEKNLRPEYGAGYRTARSAAGPSPTDTPRIEPRFASPVPERREIVLLGAAGDHILSAGALLAHAAMLGGMWVTQKNDYDITVMRGPSVSELILSPEPILYTGVEKPDVIVALAREGVHRKREIFAKMSPDGRILREKGLEIPDTPAHIMEIDFKGYGIKRTERALAALSLLARANDPITLEMLEEALRSSLQDQALAMSLDLLGRTAAIPAPG
jgi:2-oxoglutarate/2-oxoacid ferredoxin oxidoreductase subunit beta